MNKIFTPKPGTRFSLYGAQFEITFASYGMIRYAASAGGQVYRVPLNNFMDLVSSGKIEGSFFSDDACINHSNVSEVIRKRRYIEAALVELTHPTSKSALEIIIKKISIDIDDKQPPSPRSVARWIRTYRLQENEGAVNKVNSGNTCLRFSPDIEQLINDGIKNVYLTAERRSAIDVNSYVIGKAMEMGLCNQSGVGVQLPSARTIQRRIKQLDPYVVTRIKKGELAAQRMARAGGRKIISDAVMSFVQIDTHHLDIHVIDESSGDVIGRPFLTCIMDIKTRVIVGIYLGMYPPSNITALGALQDMLSRPTRNLPGGIPVRIVPDNGTEFANSSFARICEALSITITPAQVRDPNGKANLESFFRTLTYGIVQKLPGTTFSNPVERGDYDSIKNAVFTMKLLAELIDQWINDVYHKSIHSRTGRAPILDWEEQVKIMAPLSLSKSEVEVLARRPERRKIQNGKVLVDGIEYFSHALRTLEALGESSVTVLINELNLDSVLIQHPTEKETLILAESTDHEYTQGLTIYEHTEAKKIRREMTKSDMNKLGIYTNAISRWKLLEKIQEETFGMKRWLKKLTNGESKRTYTQRKISELINCTTPEALLESSVMNDGSKPSDTTAFFAEPIKNSISAEIYTYDSIELE